MWAGVRRVRGLAGAGVRRVRPTFAVTTSIALLVVFGLATTMVARATAGGHRPLTRHVMHASPAAAATATNSASATNSVPAAGRTQAPVTTRPPRVPRPKHLVPATLLAWQDRALKPAQLAAIKHISGVTRLTVVSDGTARVDGHHARVLAVNPARFRPWTPRLTAASNPLWQSIASGELTASFDMGKGAHLPLGGTVPVHSRSTHPMRIGAFATVGMGGVDAVVDGARGRQIGLPQRNALLIAAPHADPLVLRADVARALGHGGSTTLLREVIVIRDAGEFMTRAQISTILHAAASRIGMPYVWGATGPHSFDCSGLVMWSFAKAGITMPRVSEEQFFAGPHVPYADARPGDLLFWHYDPTNPTDADHVAIYAGNGEMIVAPHTGLDVQLTQVPLDHLAGVVRVDPGIASQIG